MSKEFLYQFLDRSARKYPDRVAVKEPGYGTITYQDLAALSDLLRDKLLNLGIRRGDRVGIYLQKSIDSVAAIFGILKAGAAYIPVDVGAPVSRNGFIFSDCSVKVVVIEKPYDEQLRSIFGESDANPYLLCLEETGGGAGLSQFVHNEGMERRNPFDELLSTDSDQLAYILYTSGSTGKPKGVMLTHQNAISYVDWCSEVFQPTPEDRFSSHAPFHFDLSILDIFLSIKHGSTLVLISEEVGKDPVRLARLISEERISIWYSTPSILSLLTQYGNLDQHDLSSIRMVLFAGEVFPIKHLKALKSLLPKPRYFNLYGPTETNVCTFYEIPSRIPEGRTSPFPIGKKCSHLQTRVVDDDGHSVAGGQEGELVVCGPAVTQGYWNLPQRTAKAFLTDASGRLWYKTGDVVIEEPDGNYTFIGRRDRMVKKRGYRVELGEIETVLYNHPSVKEAAVIANSDDDSGLIIKAILSSKSGTSFSIIDLKRFCVNHLPIYMVPDQFSFMDALPKTSTDKIDYQRLKEMI